MKDGAERFAWKTGDLEVGPRPTGKVTPEDQEKIDEAWLDAHPPADEEAESGIPDGEEVQGGS